MQRDIDTLKTDVADLKTKTTETGATVKPADLTALGDKLTKLETSLTELQGSVASLSTQVTLLDTRLQKLETPVSSTPTGQVTVTVDSSTPLTNISSSSAGTNLPIFKVNIVNGTNTYQYITYEITLALVTPASVSITDTALAVGTAMFNPIKIPITNTTRVMFLFPTTSGSKILVGAGQTISLWNTLTLKTDASALWQGSLTFTASTMP